MNVFSTCNEDFLMRCTVEPLIRDPLRYRQPLYKGQNLAQKCPLFRGSTVATIFIFLKERRKQQKRFREAQSTQREMSQLERQYEEMEDYGREIEQQLRDVEGSMLPLPPY